MSSAVPLSLEIEVELQDASVEARLEPVPFRHLPLTINNGKSNILVGLSRHKPDRQSVWGSILLQEELGRLGLVC